MNKKKFTPEQLKQARSTPMEFVIEGSLTKDSFNHATNEIRYKVDGTKMIISGNSFFDNEKNMHGNTLDYVMNYKNMSFVDAVKFLTDSEDITKESREEYEKRRMKEIERTQEFDFNSLEEIKKTDNRAAYDYLIQKRKIDFDIVDYCFKTDKVVQDLTTNIVFVFYNKDGEFVGGDRKGISESKVGKSFRGLIGGSDPDSAFFIQKGNVESIVYFESGVDLLSFLTLYKGSKSLNNKLFVSLSGLKDRIFYSYAEQYPNAKKVLAVDNDEAANNFIEKIREKTNNEIIVFQPPNNFKDWNELLQSKY